MYKIQVIRHFHSLRQVNLLHVLKRFHVFNFLSRRQVQKFFQQRKFPDLQYMYANRKGDTCSSLRYSKLTVVAKRKQKVSSVNTKQETLERQQKEGKEITDKARVQADVQQWLRIKRNKPRYTAQKEEEIEQPAGWQTKARKQQRHNEFWYFSIAMHLHACPLVLQYMYTVLQRENLPLLKQTKCEK